MFEIIERIAQHNFKTISTSTYNNIGRNYLSTVINYYRIQINIITSTIIEIIFTIQLFGTVFLLEILYCFYIASFFIIEKIVIN